MSRHVLPVLLLVLLAAAPARATDRDPSSGPTVDDLRRAGDLEGAARRAREILEARPHDVTAHVVHQDVLIALGREKELRQEYREPARAREATADQIYLYGRLLDGNAAIRQYRAALKKDPRHFWSLCALGSQLTQAGKLRTARDALERARTVRTDSGVPVNALGWLEERTGNPAKAEALYREAIRLSPEFPAARVNLGLLLVGLGRADDAVDVLTMAVGCAPGDPTPLLALGTAQLGAGETETAIATFEAAIALRSNTVSSLNLLATAYINLEQYDLARAALDRALEREPRSVATRVNLTYLYVTQGALDEARRAARSILRIDPRSAEAHYLIGLCEITAGEVKRAESEYRSAARLDPDNTTYLRALRILYGSQGRWPKAVEAAERIARLADDAPDMLYELAITYLGAGNARKAADTFDRVLSVDPDRLDAWLNLGVVCHEKLRDGARAARAYREYIDRGGKDPRVPGWLTALETD